VGWLGQGVGGSLSVVVRVWAWFGVVWLVFSALVDSKAAHGTENMKPKHHWVMDVAQQIQNHGVVLDCFVVERRHLMVKKIAAFVKNTTRFERSVMSGLVTTMSQMGGDCAAGLQGPTGHLHEGIVIADQMEVFGMVVARGDVVLRGMSAGLVAACCESGEGLHVIVQRATFVEHATSHASKHQLAADSLESWHCGEIRTCLAWKQLADGSLLVVRE